jgi:histidyl-tRNA synthetase
MLGYLKIILSREIISQGKGAIMGRKKTIQKIRGTYDILPSEQKYWQFVESKALSYLQKAGFGKIEFPMFEDVFLFSRSVGENTDIIEKEMYVFRDRGDDILALRPEGTASIVRAYIENGMHTLPQPVKLYYSGPMFRYDRPQAGRFRQFYQIGFEVLGEIDPIVDAEIICLTFRICQKLGLKNLTIQINSIGCSRCRPKFISELVDYVSKRRELFCQDCLKRIEKTPLRVLDCKIPTCQKVLENAPSILDFLCKECHKHFTSVLEYLDELAIPYNLNSKLARGLDYYTKTVFEIWSGQEGAQNSLCGGGRYDDLVALLGGRKTPSCGCAFGTDRIVSEIRKQGIKIPQENPVQVFIAFLGDKAKVESLKIIDQCRKARIGIVGSLSHGTLKSQLKTADKLAVPITLILGEKEVIDKTVLIRHMEEGVQEVIEVAKVVKELKKRLPK